MILSNSEIAEAVRDSHIIIDPQPQDELYTSSALDLRLGDEFRHWDPRRLRIPGVRVEVDPSLTLFDELAREYTVPFPTERDGSIILRPGDFALGITHEYVELPLEHGIAARIEGRSSLARMGLTVHLTAPVIHSGWRGQITLELLNLGPFDIKLMPIQLRVCQLVFERLGRPASIQPATRFLGQRTPLGP